MQIIDIWLTLGNIKNSYRFCTRMMLTHEPHHCLCGKRYTTLQTPLAHHKPATPTAGSFPEIQHQTSKSTTVQGRFEGLQNEQKNCHEVGSHSSSCASQGSPLPSCCPCQSVDGVKSESWPYLQLFHLIPFSFLEAFCLWFPNCRNSLELCSSNEGKIALPAITIV